MYRIDHFSFPLLSECECNTIGSSDTMCNRSVGACDCHPNVIGDLCTNCSEDTWGFNTGEAGCEPCGCNPMGSTSSSCDLMTGQCSCRVFAVGRDCSECTNGTSGSVNTGCQGEVSYSNTVRSDAEERLA